METRRKREHNSVFKQTLNSMPEKLRKMSEEVDHIKDVVVQQENKYLDLAFVMDCTSSMGPYINEAMNNIHTIVEEIVANEKSDVRLALVEYRDHPPQEYTFVTRYHDFTHSPRTMRGWLSECTSTGGGDIPEAVADALNDLLKLSWRDEATKICVCISDAPPHGLGYEWDDFPNGCPDGIDPMVVANQLAEQGITIYMAGCEPSISPYKDFFMAVANITGGQYVPMGKAQVLSKVIIGGAQEELSLNELMAEVDAEVQARVEAGDVIDEHAVSGLLHKRWQTRGTCAVQLQMDNVELNSVLDTPDAKAYSKMKTLTEVRKLFKTKHTAIASGSSSGWELFGASGTGISASSTTASVASFGSAVTGVTFGQSSRLVKKSIARHRKS